MIELVVGVSAAILLAFASSKIISLNAQLIQAKYQRDLAYRALTKVRESLDDTAQQIKPTSRWYQ